MDNLSASSGITLEEIDRLLVAWRSNLSNCSQNLLALYDLHTFKRLKGDDTLTPAKLTGLTAARVPPSLEAIAKLFDNLQLLTEVIDRAARLRQNMPRLFATERSRSQIEQLLTGNSISMPTSETPLAQRGLLSDSVKANSISPPRLLDIMTRTFEISRSVIMEVDAAWSKLEPELGTLNEEAIALNQTAVVLGEGTLPELATLQSRIATINDLIQTDPLGAKTDMQREIRPLLDTTRARLKQIDTDRGNLSSAIVVAAARIAKIETTHRQSVDALQVCMARIFKPSGLCAPLADSTVSELRAWLDTLNATFQQGNLRPVQVGLARWNDAAAVALTTAEKALSAAKAPVELLEELKGRLAAQKSRAAAAASRGVAIDPLLPNIESEAMKLLVLNPTPVDKAAAVVAEYERRLRAGLQT